MQEITEETARKPASDEVLRQIARGEVDLDQIAEVIRSAQFVMRAYEREVQEWRSSAEQAQADYQKEKSAVDDLARRLVVLHEENRLARGVFTAEIEGKRSVLGVQTSFLDLEALDMAGLIREREAAQRALAGRYRTVSIPGRS